MDLPGYDAWKLATPPDYEWPATHCEDCGFRFDANGYCSCDEDLVTPHPDEVADLIDEAQEARTE
jgi:hypothetical protein